MDVLARLSKLRDDLKQMGFERERGALAMLALSFFGILYVLVSLNGPEGWGAVFACLALCYLTAFVALAAQWFWGRWFASGLGWSGFMVGLMSLVMIGWHPSLGIYTGFHALIIGALMGKRMAERYELQPAWREKYGMDDFGVTRLGKAVTRGSASLPTLIMWALAPREGQSLLAQMLPTLAFLVGALGVAAILRLRTWGLLAVGAAAGLAVAMSFLLPAVAVNHQAGDQAMNLAWSLLGSPLLAVAWGGLALLAFARPIARFLRS